LMACSGHPGAPMNQQHTGPWRGMGLGGWKEKGELKAMPSRRGISYPVPYLNRGDRSVSLIQGSIPRISRAMTGQPLTCLF
jgi:hypothetical protein